MNDVNIDSIVEILINAKMHQDWNLVNETLVLLMSISSKYSHLDMNRLTALVKGI